MATKRYLLVEGVGGHLVSDPRMPSANPARFIGYRLRVEAATDAEHLSEHYEIVRDVVEDHADLRAPIAEGLLILHAKCTAKSPDAARAALLAPSLPTQPSKKAATAPRGDQ